MLLLDFIKKRPQMNKLINDYNDKREEIDQEEVSRRLLEER